MYKLYIIIFIYIYITKQEPYVAEDVEREQERTAAEIAAAPSSTNNNSNNTCYS